MLAETEERLTQSLHRAPSTDEMADALDLDRAEVELARQCGSAYRALSLDHSDEGGVSPAVLATGSLDLERLLRLRSVTKVLEELSERELLIVHLRFVDDLPQTQIGAVLGVSQMQVSRLLSGILTQLRERLKDTSFAA
ncbi:sigma-70 family RNA polymerase sigma factor [Knoellia sp. CPCC 206453]|uniref:sigma-70 family RNA polymerase sigma factor n=1 Tax=Knoellia pratensis TaxID=3404796 RepID=UPI00361AFBA8